MKYILYVKKNKVKNIEVVPVCVCVCFYTESTRGG